MSAPARFLVYSDGSALRNPGGPGGTGFVVVDRTRGAMRFGGRRYTVDGPFEVTNNRMELRAVLEALEGLPAGEAVEITSDSRYLIDSLSKWIHGWRRKGWVTAAGTPVLNRDLMEALSARLEELAVAWRWVRGHAGHPVNELVDRLATSAARGAPGPDEGEVVAALRAGGVLAPRR
jgi:ribonuclease HI